MAKDRAPGTRPRKKENLAERVVDRLESRFLAATEVATATTSAEENLVTAGIEAVVGHHDQDQPAEPKPARARKPRKTRSAKAREADRRLRPAPASNP